VLPRLPRAAGSIAVTTGCSGSGSGSDACTNCATVRRVWARSGRGSARRVEIQSTARLVYVSTIRGPSIPDHVLLRVVRTRPRQRRERPRGSFRSPSAGSLLVRDPEGQFPARAGARFRAGRTTRRRRTPRCRRSRRSDGAWIPRIAIAYGTSTRSETSSARSARHDVGPRRTRTCRASIRVTRPRRSRFYASTGRGR